MANTLGIRGYDVVEFYVGSAKMTAYWFSRAFGLDIVAYAGPESGVKDKTSYLLQKNKLKIVVTSPTSPNAYEVNSFTSQHGDGVKKITYEVTDVPHIFNHALSKGAVPASHPTEHQDEHGSVWDASVQLYDDTELVFVNYDKYKGLYRPGFMAPRSNSKPQREETNLLAVDHVVGNVRKHEMDTWAKFFVDVLDFETFIEFGPGDISTKYSALLSKVVRSKDGLIKNPINEPYEGLKKSQIEEYLEQYHGSGIQHIAISTNNILETIQAMRNNGVEFLQAPQQYYQGLRDKKVKIKESIDDLEKLGILCDVEDLAGGGYLLQLFTKPIGDRPTFFFEIIQRCEGSQGFGHGNFQALFESIEREQALRGNL